MQGLDQTVDRVFARNVNGRVTQADEAQYRGNLENLPRATVFHVPDGLLRQVDQRDHVDLDHLTDRLGILRFEVGVAAQPRVVDDQVDTPGHRFSLFPQRLPERGISQVAAANLYPPGRELSSERFQPVAASGCCKHSHSAAQDELADELPANSRRSARDKGVPARQHAFGLRGLSGSRLAL